MPERLTKVDVERIAALARLELGEAEKDLYTRQLAAILEFAAQIRALDTEGVEPTTHVLTRQAPERTDDPRSSLERADVFANAPEAAREAGFFTVPKVIGS
jgi:aspartyl-tRNA(Asn)/glutamyl-tRNA(Gln) amidotransferase subunit C